jgi:type II secretion system protein D
MSFNRSLALFLLGIASAYGQQPAEAPPVPVTPPGVPVPGVQAPQAAGAPAANQPAAQPGVPLGQTKITTDINEPKLSGNALAGLYRKYTGRRVIVSAAASTAEFAFVQEATPQDPLTFTQAAELLKKAAIIEGFVFVPDGTDPNLDILTLSTGGIRPTQIGTGVYNDNGPVFNEETALPEGDAVITYVMRLNYIKPDQAVNTFTQIIGQFGAYGSIAAVPNASAVVITENTSLIRKLIDLKSEIDKPGSVQGSRFIKVQYADVTEIADTLTTLLTAQQTAQKTAGVQRADGGAPQGGAPGAAQAAQAGGSAAGEDTPVQIVPDPRTNRIFAMGRPVDLIFVESLVREFDVETSEKNFLRRKLKFLTVSDFLPIAGDALNRAFTGTGGGSGTQGGATGGGGNQGGGNRTQGNNNNNRQASNTGGRSSNTSTGANFGGSSSGGGGSFGGSGGVGSALSDPDVNAAPESVLVGRTLLVADNITNSIVVQGPPSGLEIIERLLDQIDVKPDQVMISTVIGQLSIGKSRDVGVDYLFNEGDFALSAGGGLGAAIANGTNFPRFDRSTLTGSGLRAIGTIGDLGVYLKALQSKTDFTVLSRPSIFTSNNQKGTISSGERIAIPTSNNNYSGGGSSTNIEYQDVVLKLEVIPLVNSNNEITMKIALLNDEQNGTQTIAGGGSDGGDLTVPRISTREILTTATVPNGQTIVLGGLIVGRKGEEKSGIPILSDIPYLGTLFSTTKINDDRSELMVFIQPSVVSNDRSLHAVQEDMDTRYAVAPRAHTMADGPAVLPPIETATPVVVGGKESGVRQTTTTQSWTAPDEKPKSTLKPSIRPANRR